MARNEGYLFVDHRASPGLPEDIARQAGFDPRLCREGRVFEAKTLTCSHCQTPVMLNPERERARGHCPKCDHYICDLCTAKMREPDYVHMPFKKLVDLVKDVEAKGGVMLMGSAPNLLGIK